MILLKKAAPVILYLMMQRNGSIVVNICINVTVVGELPKHKTITIKTKKSMTAEQSFIRKLELYLGSDINDYGKKRIVVYLKEYAAEIPPIKKINFEAGLPAVQKKEISEETLYTEAKTICDLMSIPISDFMFAESGKATDKVTASRKIFCLEVITKYNLLRKDLKQFFGVDHTTISYYIHGKKYKPGISHTENSEVNS